MTDTLVKSDGTTFSSTLPAISRTVLSYFNLNPRRIGGIETFSRELSLQLGNEGWRSVLCYISKPEERVRAFLDLPNTRLDVEQNPAGWSISSTARFVRLIRRHRPAIVHLYFTDVFGPYAVLAKMLGVRDVYFTDQISRPEDYCPATAPRLKRALYRAFLPLSRVLCISDYVRDCWCTSEVFPSDRLKTIYNGVDIGSCRVSADVAMSFRARYSLPADIVVVTQIANMIPEKGFADLLHAASRVIKAGARVHFVLAGEGKHRGEYEALARQLKINAHVTFTGLISDPIRDGLFAASDVVCQASRWNEAFGFVIAEAMACGKPVIATRVGGIPEIVEHGETGRLVERGDVAALAQQILDLASDRNLRRRLGEQGRARCEILFDHRKNVASLIGQYGLHTFDKVHF